VDAGLIFIAGLFVLFWLLVIRPQRRRAREQDEMLGTLEVGDEVVTAGGLYGEITGLDDDDVRLEIADGIEVRVARRAIAAVTEEDELEEAEDELEEVEEEPEGAEEPEEEAAAAGEAPPKSARKERDRR
jgi:preprotein translocase subunit YajC